MHAGRSFLQDKMPLARKFLEYDVRKSCTVIDASNEQHSQHAWTIGAASYGDPMRDMPDTHP